MPQGEPEVLFARALRILPGIDEAPDAGVEIRFRLQDRWYVGRLSRDFENEARARGLIGKQP